MRGRWESAGTDRGVLGYMEGVLRYMFGVHSGWGVRWRIGSIAVHGGRADRGVLGVHGIGRVLGCMEGVLRYMEECGGGYGSIGVHRREY